MQAVPEIAKRFAPGPFERFERPDTFRRCVCCGDFLADGPLGLSQDVDVVSHLIQQAQVSVCFRNEPRMKRTNCRGLTLSADELAITRGGRHLQSTCIPKAVRDDAL
jgi:hypothetical protein